MKRRLFIRYLLCYLCFLLVLIMMYLPLHQTCLNILRKKSLETSEAMLENGLEQFERELEQVRTLATSLAINTDIMPVGHIVLPPTGKDVYMAYRAQESFTQIVSVMPSGMQVCILLPNDTLLADRYIFYSKDEMYKFIFDIQFQDAAQWFSYINGFSGSSHLFANRIISVMSRTEESLIYSCRVPLSSKSTKQLLFAIISGSHVSSLLSLSNIYDGTVLTLFGEDGTQIYKNGTEQTEMKYAGIVATSKSGFPLSARLLIPEAVFSAQLKVFNRTYLLFILIFVLVGLIVALILSYRSSRPIIHLLDSVKGYLPQDATKGRVRSGDAYQYLEDYLEGTENRFRDYQTLLGEQEKMLRSATFQMLATKPDPDENEISRAKHYFINFPARYKLVSFSMNIDLQQELERFSSCQVVLMSIVSKELPYYTAHFIGRHLLAVISEDLTKDQLDASLIKIRMAFDDAANAEINVAVSNVVSGIGMLNTARRQTQLLLRASVKPIVYMDDTNYEMSSFNSSKIFHCTNRFYNCIINADGLHASETLDEVMHYMTSCHTVNRQYTAILFHMFYVQLLRLREEMGLQELLDAALPEYDPMGNMDTLMKPFKDYAIWASDIIACHREKEHGLLADKVFSFIDKNIGNADLCLSMAADQLNLTESEIKRILLNTVNKSFFEYIDTKRMNMAREQLLQTDQTISEIMEHCGYRSLNTLYKAFKRTYGISPSQMRTQQKGS